MKRKLCLLRNPTTCFLHRLNFSLGVQGTISQNSKNVFLVKLKKIESIPCSYPRKTFGLLRSANANIGRRLIKVSGITYHFDYSPMQGKVFSGQFYLIFHNFFFHEPGDVVPFWNRKIYV